MNQPSSSSSAGGSGAGAGAGAVSVAAAFFCVVALTGMLLGAVKDRKRINVCQIRTCTCIYSKKKMLQGTGQQTELVHNSQLQTEPNHWSHSHC